MDPAERMKNLTAKAAVNVSNNIAGIKYYRSGVQIARQAKIYHSEGNIEQAYMLYLRYITLFIEKIRTHPDYASIPEGEKSTVMKNVNEMFPAAEKLKAILLERYKKEYEHFVQRKEGEKNEAKDDGGLGSFSLDVDSSLNISDGMRKILLPSSLIPTFLQLAKANTEKNIETCSLLTGTLQRDTLTITVLLVPQQTGTSDDCTAENDLATFNVIENRNLITLGWIHTHPSQSAFLSSVDLHSQFGYQSMLPEAIAIVCAPRYTNEIFRLTDMGLDTIRNCSARGFHQHPGPSPFEVASHAYIVDIPLETVDLRKLPKS